MEQDNHTDEQIRDILSLRKVVIGMSKNSSKAAHYVPKYLADNGYDVTPVNLTSDEILSRKSYNSVSEINEKIDIVDTFKPSDQVLPFIQEAIKKKPKVIWLQEGIHNVEAEELARKEGIAVVADSYVINFEEVMEISMQRPYCKLQLLLTPKSAIAISYKVCITS